MMSHRIRTATLLVALASLPGFACAAASPAFPDGRYSGVITQGKAELAFTVTFQGAIAKLHFDVPVSCGVPANRFMQVGTTTVYRFDLSQNGGRFCDDLTNRDLTVAHTADGRLTVDFDTASGHWKGQLDPPQP